MNIVAVIADVHSNGAALQAVMIDAYGAGAREVWFLGDLVGYGPNPLKVWTEVDGLMPWRWRVTCNHDYLYLGKMGALIELPDENGETVTDTIDANLIALKAMALNVSTTKEFKAEPLMRRWLDELPRVVSPRAGVYMVHGKLATDDPYKWITEYTKTESNVDAVEMHRWLVEEDGWKRFASGGDLEKHGAAGCQGWSEPQLVLVGHWHHQFAWRRDRNDGAAWIPLPTDSNECLIGRHARGDESRQRAPPVGLIAARAGRARKCGISARRCTRQRRSCMGEVRAPRLDRWGWQALPALRPVSRDGNHRGSP